MQNDNLMDRSSAQAQASANFGSCRGTALHLRCSHSTSRSEKRRARLHGPVHHARRLHQEQAVQARRVVLVQRQRDALDQAHHLGHLHGYSTEALCPSSILTRTGVVAQAIDHKAQRSPLRASGHSVSTYHLLESVHTCDMNVYCDTAK